MITFIPTFVGMKLQHGDVNKVPHIVKLGIGDMGVLTITNKTYGRLKKMDMFDTCKDMLSLIKRLYKIHTDEKSLANLINDRIGESLYWISASHWWMEFEDDTPESEMLKILQGFNYKFGYIPNGYYAIPGDSKQKATRFIVKYHVMLSKDESYNKINSRIQDIKFKLVRCTYLPFIVYRDKSLRDVQVTVDCLLTNNISKNDYITQVEYKNTVFFMNPRRSKTSISTIPNYCKCCNEPLITSNGALCCTSPACVDVNKQKLKHWCEVLKIDVTAHCIRQFMLFGITNIHDLLVAEKSILGDEYDKIQHVTKKIEDVPLSDSELLHGVLPNWLSKKECKILNSTVIEDINQHPSVLNGDIKIPKMVKITLENERYILSSMRKLGRS